MQLSPIFKSSPHIKVSPDGRSIAVLSPASATIWSATTLRVIDVIKLPQDLTGSIASLLWSPSSSKILISTADAIHVVELSDVTSWATIRNPAATTGKSPIVRFGADDSEVVVCSTSGLKLLICDLETSTAVEVTNPKNHHPATLSRGLAFRPLTSHLALLTRTNGKDFVSIHCPGTRKVQQSWAPETIDAQGLLWTPDGMWLLVWESAAHGSKLLLYSPDGQHLRTIDATSLSLDRDAELAPGIKVCVPSPSSELCAVGDHSRGVAVLETGGWRAKTKLVHPTTIVPRDTLQVWQEQLSEGGGQGIARSFIRAAHMISPPTPASEGHTSGCSLAAFDASSALLATRLDDSPCTLWIWDVPAAELRAVLIFHSTVIFSWHQFSRELLLVQCQDEAYRGTSFVWDPLSLGPMCVSTSDHLPAENGSSKRQVTWVSRDSEFPELLISDTKHFAMLSLSDANQYPNPWDDTTALERGGDVGELSISTDDTSTVDDTFSFRNTRI